jgi:multicomponent Na+:H+ antiporter subunit B
MRKTDILDVAGRKLAPYMFLFGLYLISFGAGSPGGGFQGGVVVASGLILLAMTRGVSRTSELASPTRLKLLELIGFAAFLLAGLAGVIATGSFLADVFTADPGASTATTDAQRFSLIPGEPSVFLLNFVIGIKVAAGVGLICLTLFEES